MRKFIKDIRDKINGMLDDVATQLGLQPKLIPARIKKSKRRKK